MSTTNESLKVPAAAADHLTMTTHAELLATQSTAALVESLLILDATESTPDQRMARAWIIEAIEARHPEVNPAMDAWADDLDTEVGYVAALLAALPAEALQ